MSQMIRNFHRKIILLLSRRDVLCCGLSICPTERRCHNKSQCLPEWLPKEIIIPTFRDQQDNILEKRDYEVTQLCEILDIHYPGVSGCKERIETCLKLLKSLGCTLQDLASHPDVILISEGTLIARKQTLVNLRRKVTAKSLVSFPCTCEGSTNDSPACDFSCKYRTNFIDVDGFFTCQHYIPKMKYFMSLGLTDIDIQQNSFILKESLSKTKEFLNDLEFILFGKSDTISKETIDMLIESERINVLLRVKNTDMRLRQIAMLMEMPVSEARLLPYTDVNLKVYSKKIAYLLKLGIEKRDLLNHMYLLRNSFKKLQEGVKAAEESGIVHMRAVTLINIIQHKVVPHHIGKPRHHYFLSRLLQVPPGEVSCLDLALTKQVCATNKVTLITNRMYLLSLGFSNNDILQCILILTHEPSTLKLCVKSLPDNEEFQPHECFAKDKVLFLNTVQYILERETTFSGEHQTGGM